MGFGLRRRIIISPTHTDRRREKRYLRCTTSGAAGNGLGATIKYLRGAAGIGLDITSECLRCATSAAANNCLGTTIRYLANQNTGAGHNWAKANVYISVARIQINPPVVKRLL
jgi:hypothetical protein